MSELLYLDDQETINALYVAINKVATDLGLKTVCRVNGKLITDNEMESDFPNVSPFVQIQWENRPDIGEREILMSVANQLGDVLSTSESTRDSRGTEHFFSAVLFQGKLSIIGWNIPYSVDVPSTTILSFDITLKTYVCVFAIDEFFNRLFHLFCLPHFHGNDERNPVRVAQTIGENRDKIWEGTKEDIAKYLIDPKHEHYQSMSFHQVMMFAIAKQCSLVIKDLQPAFLP